MLPPTAIVARDPQSALVKAVQTGTLKDFDPNKCEVLIRAFA